MLFKNVPKKKYSIIYADPPWKYDNRVAGIQEPAKASNHYPTLSLDELSSFPIGKISEDNCLLFLWCTGPKFDVVFDLGKEWGFEYKTVAFVWDKMIVNAGYYTLSQYEFCLVFKKGKIPKPRGSRKMRQRLVQRKSKHSKKPNEIRSRITRMFPTQSKIELFARQRFDNWDAWGNQV